MSPHDAAASFPRPADRVPEVPFNVAADPSTVAALRRVEVTRLCSISAFYVLLSAFFLANKYGLPVTPIPPVLQLVPAPSGTVAFQWATTLGRQYQLQSATNLPTASWANEGAPLNGTGGVLTNTLPVGRVPTKFFRLLLLGN
jgi:hypothetical protein